MTLKNLLGKNISEAYELIDNGFELDTSNNNLYFMSTESYKYFYDMPTYYILISNNENIIDSITLYFHGIIDKGFYSSFTNDFGNPSTIQVIENVEIISEEKLTESPFSQHLRKNFIETKEGTFDEKPLFMIWDKESYQIKILLNHQSNISIITFRNPTDKF